MVAKVLHPRMVPITNPSTSPMAHPVRQCAVALNASFFLLKPTLFFLSAESSFTGLPIGRRRYLDAVLDRDRDYPPHILRAFGDRGLGPVHCGLAYLLDEALVQAPRCLAHQQPAGRRPHVL